jgi:peroxiredoxin
MGAATTRSSPIRPDEPAPAFTLPAAHGEGTVSLGEYLGLSPVLLALFRGLY